MGQLDIENGRLNAVQSAVHPDALVLIPLPRSVVADHPQALGHGRITREARSSISVATQVFGRKETRGANGAHGPRHAPRLSGLPGLPSRANGLRGVFHNVQPMRLGNAHNGIHVRALAIEVNGQNGLCARRDGRLHRRGVHIECLGIDIHHDGRQPQQLDHFNRGDVSKRRGDDLVSRLEAQGHEGGLQGIGAVGARDDMNGRFLG